MEKVTRRRADITKLIRAVKEEAGLRQRKIDTVDPVVRNAKHLFPYLHEDVVYEYARTALRVILNHPITGLNDHQTTLLAHIP